MCLLSVDVIHTVGPIGKQERSLKSCYKKCLHLVKKHGIRSVVRILVQGGCSLLPSPRSRFPITFRARAQTPLPPLSTAATQANRTD